MNKNKHYKNMMRLFNLGHKHLFSACLMLACVAGINSSMAQCLTTMPAHYTNSCLNDYFTSIMASGPGVISSSISYSAGSCTGTYNYLYATQGIVATAGDTVNINISRATTTYNAYLAVYIDQNNDGMYYSTELVGTMVPVLQSVSTATYSFAAPSCGVTGTILHMRVMMFESPVGAGPPCVVDYGQTCDFSFYSGCPSSVTLSGPSSVCVGDSTTLTCALACGTWSSSNPSVASVSTSGVVTGVSNGTATISYTTPSCGIGTVLYTVNGSSVTGGPGPICGYTTLTLSAATPGGTWSSTNTAVGTVSGGVVTGMYGGGGTTTINYSLGGCTYGTIVSVNPTPHMSGAPFAGCGGATPTMIGCSAPGTWSTSNPGVATVAPVSGYPFFGNVTGVSNGTVTIYCLPPGYTCPAACTMSVFQIIYGSNTLCLGVNSLFNAAQTGGTWSSSNSAIASCTATGFTNLEVINGVSLGTATITYTAPGCWGTLPVTVDAITAITGSTSTILCGGSPITLSATPPGTWSSSNSAVASVSSGGVVTGMSAGSATISCASSLCAGTYNVTVTPPHIWGPPSLECGGSTISLFVDISGGTWSSSNTGIATITSGGGVVTAVSVGTATISYVAGGCVATYNITVTPPIISGSSSVVCGGSPVTLSADISGGTWSSSNTGVATVTSGGVVTGVANGTVTISYTTGGCVGTYVVTVGGPTISGPSSVCQGSDATLTVSVPGGSWSSSNTYIADFISGSTIHGYNTGTINTTYSISSGCVASRSLTVYGLATISGNTSVCPGGYTSTLSASIPSGTWASYNTSIATISSSGGVLSGVSVGGTTVSYTVNGCSTPIGVSTYFPSITTFSIGGVCSGTPITYVANPTGGTWNSSHPGIATISSGGVITYVTTGTTDITYSVGGCTTAAINITSAVTPGSISGPNAFCSSGGLSTAPLPHYVCSPAGGTWGSPTPGLGIDAGGYVTSRPVGAAVITYSTSPSCHSSLNVHGDLTPAPGCCWAPGPVAEWPCVFSSCWGPDNISGMPDYGVWTTSHINLGTITTSGGVSATTAYSAVCCGTWISPPYWNGGWAKYTISYPSDGLGCYIEWDFHD